uniref:G_PROTEIN_RECEP_F1_2 domain-containing protein n=1 Tax=Macrostomum lignano TaxID=282301 RepID=A0A1I8FK97_9PLAT
LSATCLPCFSHTFLWKNIVFTVVILSLLLWVPACAIIAYQDRIDARKSGDSEADAADIRYSAARPGGSAQGTQLLPQRAMLTKQRLRTSVRAQAGGGGGSRTWTTRMSSPVSELSCSGMWPGRLGGLIVGPLEGFQLLGRDGRAGPLAAGLQLGLWGCGAEKECSAAAGAGLAGESRPGGKRCPRPCGYHLSRRYALVAARALVPKRRKKSALHSSRLSLVKHLLVRGALQSAQRRQREWPSSAPRTRRITPVQDSL